MAAEVPFVTETMNPESISYRMMQDLFHIGHHPINANIRPNGLIEYERGAAAVGITPHNEMILLSTTDIDDMEIIHRMKTADGRIRQCSHSAFTRQYKTAPQPRDVLPDGSTYIGQFIKHKINADGDENYSHILGIAAWEPTPRQLVHSLLHEFSAYHRQDLLESGILMHHDPLVWTSKEMVFVAQPQIKRGESGEPEPVLNDKGDPLYTMSTLMAPRKGWDATKLYNRLYGKSRQGIFKRLPNALLRGMMRAVRTTKKDMTMAEIEAHVQENFAPLAKHMRQGGSPYKGRIRRAFATAVFGMDGISRMDMLVGVALPGSIALGGVLTEHEGLTISALAVPFAILAARFGFLWAVRANHNFDKKMFEDLVHRFWNEGVKRKNLPQQFEMVRPDVLQRLRILPRDELDAMSRVPTNKVSAGPGWDILYLLGTQNGPYGSHSSAYKVGEQWVIRVDEDAGTSGLIIEYWPMQNIAFAKDPLSDHLPQRLINAFTSAEHPIRAIRAVHGANGRITDYESEFISHEQYRQMTETLAAQPSRSLYRGQECSPELLRGYPLAEPKRRHDGLGEESEWAQDSKAASLAEFIAEVAKFVFRH